MRHRLNLPCFSHQAEVSEEKHTSGSTSTSTMPRSRLHRYRDRLLAPVRKIVYHVLHSQDARDSNTFPQTTRLSVSNPPPPRYSVTDTTSVLSNQYPYDLPRSPPTLNPSFTFPPNPRSSQAPDDDTLHVGFPGLDFSTPHHYPQPGDLPNGNDDDDDDDDNEQPRPSTDEDTTTHHPTESLDRIDPRLEVIMAYPPENMVGFAMAVNVMYLPQWLERYLQPSRTGPDGEVTWERSWVEWEEFAGYIRGEEAVPPASSRGR
ncbi:hypothetical protein K461DRAFT_295958 [Myriangium duriaei CBS 260.36]|uniref:Uncharacterized protein n=1 Tax=Myriangium duriaei CBS 260.36 TaxID=1168546 RepID=A0A9P4IZK3_9PEZI|nr:hypothetical protein K461DRAFT_295958 [Myriangium duriaei CBS 260.36]